MELERTVGLRPDGAVWLPERRSAIRSILLKLAAMGVQVPEAPMERNPKALHWANGVRTRS